MPESGCVPYPLSPIKLGDYAAGVMAAFGSVVEYLGVLGPAVTDISTVYRVLVEQLG